MSHGLLEAKLMAAKDALASEKEKSTTLAQLSENSKQAVGRVRAESLEKVLCPMRRNSS